MIQTELNQSRLKGGQRLSKKKLQRVLNVCARVLNVKNKKVVSIGFVSSTQMRRLNKTWRGKDRVTDVLSFILDEEPLAGEILLSYEQARRQAREMGHTTRDELWFLIVHGVLHVFGYDHELSSDAQKMFTLQKKILDTLSIDSRVSVVSNVEL